MTDRLDLFQTTDKCISTERPSLKELYRDITPHYAADWKAIGLLLGIPIGNLNAIEYGCPTNAKRCCNQMFEAWLETDTAASREKLHNVIKSPAVCSSSDYATALATSELDQLTVTGDEAITTLCNIVTQINIQGRLKIDQNTWPQWQPKGYIPLLLVYYRGGSNFDQMIEMTKLKHDVNVTIASSDRSVPKVYPCLDSDDIFLDCGTETNNISEILASLENSKDPSLVLIEGAPGIGKSVLLKEIACGWAEKKWLQSFKLVLLLCLRDPILQQICTIDGLLTLFCKGFSNTKLIARYYEKYLCVNNGKTLTLLLDGYDEYPEKLRDNSLIAGILNRQILSQCGLVVSSRSHALQHLRQKANVVVHIKGFTETERQHYIEQELQGEPQKVEELKQYLDKQLTMDKLCFVPFTMVILLHLFKVAKSLPKNAVELYNHFICSTVCRYLSKSGSIQKFNFSSLGDLPEPFNRIIKQLSLLSLQGLNNNQLTFTLDEIMAACPDIAATPDAIDGFGLLQAVQHFGPYSNTITLNFIHFTIQEFLAAYSLTLLPPDKEFQVIKEKFWSISNFNMFSMYTSLTKGQQSSFKDFLSGGNETILISQEFLNDQLKCLHLYSCFKEAGDQNYCHAIEQAKVFVNKVIFLKFAPLLANVFGCISLFLTSSSIKNWETINLSFCHVHDSGLRVLHRGLHHCKDVTIKELSLWNNNLTDKSAPLISDITIKCKVNQLLIDGNFTIGENLQLYSMLTLPETTLQRLDMKNVKLTSQAAINLFDALQLNKKLEILDISSNSINDDVCHAMTTSLEMNHCLQMLNMYGNQISFNTSKTVVQALQINDKLKLLVLPDCTLVDQDKIEDLKVDVNRTRESQGCQVKLEVQFAPYTTT